MLFLVAVDNEEVDEIPIFIHDKWGKYITKEDIVTIVWEDAEYIYTIIGSAKVNNELKKMAETTTKVSMED